MSLKETFSLPVEALHNTEQYPMAQFHSHAEYEIYYFQGGNCHYLIGDRIFTLVPGDLILMHGMTLHAPNVDPRERYERTIIHFDPSFAAELLRPPFSTQALTPFQELGNVRLRLDGKSKDQVESLLKQLVELYQRDDSLSYQRFLITFLDLLHTVYECSTADRESLQTEPSGPKEQSVQRIVAFLERNYMKDIHLEMLERELHLNKFYITKLFKKVTGFTIFNYLYQLRINQAKITFLVSPGKSVTEVGYDIGFKHPSHFSRAFKRIAGVTPEQYRRSL